MQNIGQQIEAALVYLDRIRAHCYHFTCQTPWLARCLMDREARIATGTFTHAVIAFIAVLLMPMLMFFMAPLIAGVPHLASDVRYLLLRQNNGKSWRNTMWFGFAGFLTVSLLRRAGCLPQSGGAESLLGLLWVGYGICAAILAGGSFQRAILAGAGWLFMENVYLTHNGMACLMFVHAHNWIALLVWATLFRRNLKALVLPGIFIVSVVAMLCSGVLTNLVMHAPLGSFGVSLAIEANRYAPGLAPKYAVGLTAAFIFLQSVHYGIWLWGIPQDANTRSAPLSFRMSARAIVRDFSVPGVALVAALMALMFVGTLLAPRATFEFYMACSAFHGYFELSALTHLWIRQASTAPQTVTAVHP